MPKQIILAMSVGACIFTEENGWKGSRNVETGLSLEEQEQLPKAVLDRLLEMALPEFTPDLGDPIE